MKVEGAWTRNTQTLPWRGTSAGGGYSSVADLLKFAQALTSHKILSAHWVEQATREQGGGGSGYGYGFVTGSEGGVHFFGHSGGAKGMNGVLRVYPDSGTVVAVLSNLGPPAANYAADWLCRRMPLHAQ
jgi:CubicO group peptidase (beta-lactamase class C family)